jgi:hypothetical protein
LNEKGGGNVAAQKCIDQRGAAHGEGNRDADGHEDEEGNQEQGEQLHPPFDSGWKNIQHCSMVIVLHGMKPKGRAR